MGMTNARFSLRTPHHLVPTERIMDAEPVAADGDDNSNEDDGNSTPIVSSSPPGYAHSFQIGVDSLPPQCAASRPVYGISLRSATKPAWSDGKGRLGVTSLSPRTSAFVASTAPRVSTRSSRW